MKHSQHAQVSADIAWLPCDVLQSSGTLAEEQVVAEPLVRAEDGAELLRNRECDQEVADRQESCGLLGKPLLAWRIAALVAGAVAATMISKAAGAAVIARVEAATLRRGVAAQDGVKRAAMRLRHPRAVLVQVGRSVTRLCTWQ